MELPFEKKVCRYYRQKRYDLVNVEQTQEVKLPESMPDIGRIIASWGQVVLRGKDWKSNGAGINGGVMVWVLYAPEDDGPIQRFESWIPWKTNVDFQDSGEDGTIRLECVLRSVDARNVSGRKMILRAGIGVMVQILSPETAEIYEPGEMPEDVERLERTYPLIMTRESGEKTFLLDEDLNLPAGMPPVEEMVYFHMETELLDQKVMGSKAVFRGVGNLHLLYMDENRKFCSQDFELPFAQYVELDGEYAEDAEMSDLLCLTSLEVEPQPEGTIHVKCGIVNQYVINAATVVQVLEDAYSPCRDVELEYEPLELPVWAQQILEEQTCSAELDTPNGAVVDVGVLPDAVSVIRQPGMDTVSGGCNFQALIQNDDGTLVGKNVKSEVSRDWKTSCNTICFSWVKGTATCRKMGENWRFETQIALDLQSLCNQSVNMVHSVNLGEEHQPDPERPSVIVRAKNADQSLWDLAKDCGSTVGAIRKMNRLEADPEENQLLLIPVI